MKLSKKTYGCLAALMLIPFLMGTAYAQAAPIDGFNGYVLRAVDALSKSSSGMGYGNHSYTKTIEYGSETINASGPPLTMCVAAVAEVIITAIKMYVSDTGDVAPMKYLPAPTWTRMRPYDLRSHIWVAPELDSYGTADALVTFGIGRRVKFSELTPGSFVNLNRRNKSGHAVVFISYVDNTGKELKTYSSEVAGFRYFSSQGVGVSPNAGLGYRIAFFTYSDGRRICPSSTFDGTRRDCDVIYSLSQKYLNTGYMLMPKHWDAKQRDLNIDALSEGLYKQSRSRGMDFLGLSSDLSKEQFLSAIRSKDTLRLNPVFETSNRTTDDD